LDPVKNGWKLDDCGPQQEAVVERVEVARSIETRSASSPVHLEMKNGNFVSKTIEKMT
jgi:hypothetical protein